MSNELFNRMLFIMFCEQNAEKSFDEFGTLGGADMGKLFLSIMICGKEDKI